jgi:hypothetical protein
MLPYQVNLVNKRKVDDMKHTTVSKNTMWEETTAKFCSNGDMRTSI